MDKLTNIQTKEQYTNINLRLNKARHCIILKSFPRVMVFLQQVLPCLPVHMCKECDRYLALHHIHMCVDSNILSLCNKHPRIKYRICHNIDISMK